METFIEEPNIGKILKDRESSILESLYKYWNDYLIKGKLPSYNWLVKNIFKEKPFRAGTSMALEELSISQFYSKEFVHHLADTISSLKATKLIEIGAGDGLLSYFLLKEEGIDIVPTDSKTRNDVTHPEFVVKLSHEKALERYNPDVVLINWEEHEKSCSVDVLNYPSVKCIVWIGEYFAGFSDNEKLWDYECEDAKNPFSLCEFDSLTEVQIYPRVYVFYPTKK